MNVPVRMFSNKTFYVLPNYTWIRINTLRNSVLFLFVWFCETFPLWVNQTTRQCTYRKSSSQWNLFMCIILKKLTYYPVLKVPLPVEQFNGKQLTPNITREKPPQTQGFLCLFSEIYLFFRFIGCFRISM